MSIVIDGIGTRPTRGQATIVTIHSGVRGSMTITRSPCSSEEETSIDANSFDWRDVRVREAAHGTLRVDRDQRLKVRILRPVIDDVGGEVERCPGSPTGYSSPFDGWIGSLLIITPCPLRFSEQVCAEP